VLHSSQDHLEIGMSHRDSPISYWCKKHQQLACQVGGFAACFSSTCFDVSLTELSFIANGSNLTGVGLALGSTICFSSIEFTADHLGRLSLPPPPNEWDSSTIFVGMVYSGSPSLRTALKESFDEDGTASGARGRSGSPHP
jgi:hypothetical protein